MKRYQSKRAKATRKHRRGATRKHRRYQSKRAGATRKHRRYQSKSVGTTRKHRRGKQRWRKSPDKKAQRARHRRMMSQIDQINRRQMQQGLLKIVDGYYYRKYKKSDRYWSNGLGGLFTYQNGQMISTTTGRPWDWRKSAEEHRWWD